MALFADTPDGLVILAGCAHAGIVNILEHVASLRPGRPLHAVVGGFHLISAGEDRINATLSAFEKHQIAQLVPGHCTGETAIAKIRARFPDRIQTLHTGKVLDFGT